MSANPPKMLLLHCHLFWVEPKTLLFYHIFIILPDAIQIKEESWRILKNLNLDLDINAGGQIEPHQHIDGLGIRVHDIDQPVVSPDLKVFLGILVNERPAPDGEFFDAGG